MPRRQAAWHRWPCRRAGCATATGTGPGHADPRGCQILPAGFAVAASRRPGGAEISWIAVDPARRGCGPRGRALEQHAVTAIGRSLPDYFTSDVADPRDVCGGQAADGEHDVIRRPPRHRSSRTVLDPVPAAARSPAVLFIGGRLRGRAATSADLGILCRVPAGGARSRPGAAVPQLLLVAGSRAEPAAGRARPCLSCCLSRDPGVTWTADGITFRPGGRGTLRVLA